VNTSNVFSNNIGRIDRMRMLRRYGIIAAIVAAAIVATIGVVSAYKYYSTPEIQGSANLAAVIENFIKENRKVTFESASKTVEAGNVGVIVTEGRFTVMQGYLVYAFRVVDLERGESYKMIVDAGNGSVLYTSEPVIFRSSKYAYANIAVKISDAATNAVKEVVNGTVESGKLIIDKNNGSAFYTFMIKDGEGKFYMVRVDAKDGSVIDVVETGNSKGWYKEYWHDHYYYGYGHEYGYGYKHGW
jgi:uncharacterized membrane protein YkoI